MNNIKKTIGWAEYSWNYVVGCKRNCSFCYARKIRQRFNPDIPFTQLVRYDDRLEQPLKLKKHSKIFVGSMSDIEYWDKADMDKVLKVVKQSPQHKFLFLTKNGLVYDKYDFPENCWLGVTSIDGDYKFKVQKKRLLFLSLEPLLKEPKGLWLNSLISWVIIGGLTPQLAHKKIWIDNIIKECRRLSIPVYVKNNARYDKVVKEFPNEKTSNTTP